MFDCLCNVIFWNCVVQKVEKKWSNSHIRAKRHNFPQNPTKMLWNYKTAKNRPIGQMKFYRLTAFKNGQISTIWPKIGQVGNPVRPDGNKTGLPWSILRKANFRTEKGQKRFNVTRMANSQKWQKISKFGHKLPTFNGYWSYFSGTQTWT